MDATPDHNRPLRILQVVDCLNGGGLQTMLLEWLRRLPRDRFQTEVVSLFGPGPLSPAFEQAGFPVTHLAPFRWHPMIPLRLAPWLRRDYDLVHAHLVISSFLCERMMPPSRLDRLVVHVHNPACGSGRYQDWIERFAYRRAGHVLAFSKHVLGTVGPRKTGRVLYNGVDTERFTPPTEEERAAARAKFGLPGNAFVVGAVGRLAPQKNHALLLNAFATAHKALPGARLLVAGDGPLRGALEEQARRLGLAEVVHFAGFQEDILPCLAAMDVYAMSSRYEGHSISLMEAMACGLPCVSTAYPGAEEVIVPEETGCLVSPDDAPALAEALLRLGGGPELRRRLGAATRTSIAASFSLDSSANALAAFYHGVTR
ncbi:MAG: glycosyltransferase [Candidatus Hydrogenedens sp.]|nr:glycosyltransferase [Candidatus Hydrogenedens sp.]